MLTRADWERAQRIADEARRRYGVVGGIWSDPQLERALADYELPPLERLPAVPTGMFVGLAIDVNGDNGEEDRRRWRRMNAVHLLGHAVLNGRRRCAVCESWGEDEPPC